MKGLELAKAYYEAYGKPMIEEQFPEIAGRIATGLAGAGSECLGYDDETSRDHDFEPGFCIWIPGEEQLDRKTAFQLERAYAKLPKEFEGFRRSTISPVGGSRHGVLRIGDFLLEKTGTTDGTLTTEKWLKTPEMSLLEATNGEVWRDDSGFFTAIRENLAYFPEEVRLKKLAGCLLLMAQSGQYNFTRCLSHGEIGAAQLAIGEFVGNAIHAAFLLEKRYLPYYKWQFRALREFDPELADDLEGLLTTANTKEFAESKQFVIEDVASRTIEKIQEQNLTKAICGDLEKHAYSVNDEILDSELRNLHVLFAV